MIKKNSKKLNSIIKTSPKRLIKETDDSFLLHLLDICKFILNNKKNIGQLLGLYNNVSLFF